MASFMSLNSEDLLSLPIEVWIQIWSLLDFDTLQKKCTRVSKKWFQEIRDSPSLSAEMKLKVSTFQKQIFLFSYEPKNERKYFLNSAIVSTMSQIKKMKAIYYINQGVFNSIEALIFSFDPF